MHFERPLGKRVVVTGLGVVSCVGTGKLEFWQAVRDGRSGISRIESFDTSEFNCKIGGEVKRFNPLDYMDSKEARKVGRFVHFAVAAARLALADADINLERTDRTKIGTIFGSTSAGNGNIADEHYRVLWEEGIRAAETSAVNEIPTHAASCHVAIELGLKGPCLSESTACATGVMTIARGFDTLRNGLAKCMVVGASEACLSPFAFGLMCRQRVFSTNNDDPEHACRPFDKNRDGLVAGEGGGALVLETAEAALKRGAPIYAEVIGYGVASEAFHMVISHPDGEALGRAITSALAHARISPSDIDYVCPHGIANRQYDLTDARGYKIGLGERIHNVPISSIKGATAQPFAAGGQFQAIATCMAMTTDTLPPTINYETVDEECNFDVVPNRARRARVDTAVINGHSFGGTHAVLVLRRFEA